jgi:hypothetical protein
MSSCADPQPTIAIAKKALGSQGRRYAAKRVVDQLCAGDLTDAIHGNQPAGSTLAWSKGLWIWDWCGEI